MAETNGEGEDEISSLPERAVQRLVSNLQYDLQRAKRKSKRIIASVFVLLIEKWLGFWITLISVTLTVGSLGMVLVYAAEIGSTVPALSNTVPWLLGHIWIVGLLVVLTYGAILFSLLLVSSTRLVLWGRNIYIKFWNRDTPPFSTETSEEESKQWPPTDQQRKEAWNHSKDYLGNGSVFFISILFVLFLFEQLATETLNQLLSSHFITIIGSSLDVGIGVLDLDSALGMAAPDASQPELVLFILFFVLPAAVMAIGTRNLLFLMEGWVREHIEKVRNRNLINRSMAILSIIFLYTLGICSNIIIQWT